MSTDTTNFDDLRKAVTAELEAVDAPDASTNAVDAGYVVDVSVDADDRVTVGVDASDLDDRRAFLQTVAAAARSVDGVAGAHVEPAGATDASDGTDDVEAADRTAGVEAFDRVVAVASTKGGVGKSTVATNLACALAGGDRDVGLFDADIYGPNVPALLGVDGPVHSTDDGNPVPVDVDGMEVMSVGLLARDGPLAWRGAMAHDALSELFGDTAWRAGDVLVVDLPPGTGDTVLTTLQEVPVDGVVFVTTPFHTSVEDTRRGLTLFEENDVPVLGVVRNMESFTCPSCGDEHAMFPGEDDADDLPTPVLAEVPFERDLQRSPAPGEAPEAFATLGDRVVERLERVWTADVPDDALDLRDVPPDDRHEAVRSAFSDLHTGAPFTLVSDRDPSPVRRYLAELAGETPDALDVEVERATPETWLLRTEHP